MLHSALDIERFVQLNVDTVRLTEIKRQLDDERREWIRIDVPKGRKSSPPFYSLVPRDIAKLVPVLDQQGKPITSKNSIHYAWQNALKRAGFTYKHFGPHNLRSAWTGEATRRKLEPVVREHQMGHMVDGENYQRMQQDERWVTEQFRKAWETEETATTHDLQERDGKIQQLETQIREINVVLKQTAEFLKPELVETLRGWSPTQLEELAKRLRRQTKTS
jgi:polyhydroxyalkanoate synthesis regulator phasin